MSKFETVAVPMTDLPDGRQAITLRDYVEHDWVRAFVKAWPDYWQFDMNLDCFVSEHMNRKAG